MQKLPKQVVKKTTKWDKILNNLKVMYNIKVRLEPYYQISCNYHITYDDGMEKKMLLGIIRKKWSSLFNFTWCAFSI